MSQSNKTSPQEELGELLRDSGMTLCAAESCTGGNISHLITLVPGASTYYKGSVTSYAVEIKNKLLSVPRSTVEDFGIVSPQVASAMAEGVRELMGTTFSLATTGWADSYGDEHEPAGTCWLAVSGPSGTVTRKLSSHRSRKANIDSFTRSALSILTDYIRNFVNN